MTNKTQLSSQVSSPVKYLSYLDGLRAVAAFYVVLHHASLQLPDPPARVAFLTQMASGFLREGHYAVTVFIVLSGFCLMLPITKHGSLQGGALKFFRKRAWRILPPYFLTLALSLLLIATLIGEPTRVASFWVWNLSIPVTPKDLVLHLFLIQDLFSTTANKINYVLWSVAVEYRIYFLFPLILTLWKKWNPFLVTALVLSFFYVLQVALRFTPLNISVTGVCAHFVGLFMLGMLACEISFSTQVSFTRLRDLIWGKMALLFFILFFTMLQVPKIPFYINDFVVALWISSLLIHVSSKDTGLTKTILSNKLISGIGTFSYSVYLIHPFVLQLSSKFLVLPLRAGYNETFLLSMIIGGALTLGAAYLFFLTCERPFINTKNRRIG